MTAHRFMAFLLVGFWWVFSLLALPAVMLEWFIRWAACFPANNTLRHELTWVYLRKPELLFEYLTEGYIE